MVNKIIDLATQIAKNFRKVFFCKQDHIIEYGGRAGTKSARNALRVADSMLNNPYAEWFVIRKHAVHHANSTIQDMIIAFERLGLIRGEDFEYKKSQRKIVLKINGTDQYIHFEGADDVERLKGYRPSGSDKYFAGVWLFEITELKDEYEIEQIISSVARGDKPDFLHLYEFNPPESKAHWVYKWIEKVQKNKDEYRVIFSTYLDLTEWELKNWLGIKMLKSIERLKAYDYDLYKHIYLGKSRKLIGAIYARVFKNSDKKVNPIMVSIGLDFGWTESATMLETVVTDYNEVQVVDELKYNDPQRDTVSTRRLIKEYVTKICQLYKGKLIYLVPDNADQAMMQSVANDLMGLPVEVIDMGAKESIEERITAVTHMMALNILHVSESIQELSNTFEDAVRDNEGKRVDDGSYNNDALDAFEYALYPFWDIFSNLLEWKSIN